MSSRGGPASPPRLKPPPPPPPPPGPAAGEANSRRSNGHHAPDEPPAGATTTELPLPQHLLAYLRDQPLAVAVFPHAPLQDDDALPAPVYQNPALLHFLGQGIGGAAPSAYLNPRMEQQARREGLNLSDAVDERSKELLRRFLKDGVEHAVDSTSPPVPTGAIPSPGVHTGPLRVFHPSHTPSSSSTSTPGPRPRPGSSGSTASFSSRLSRFQQHRQIALQLVSGVNFSKVHWRATIWLEYGCTALTMLPASTVANGGLFTEAGEEDEDEDDLVEFGEEACRGAGSAGEVGGDYDDGETLAGYPRSPRDDDDHAGNDGGHSPTPSEARTEPERFPLSVQLARARLHKRTPCERIGDLELSHSGARDAVSLEGLAYTDWYAPIGLFRVNKDLSITQANPKWRQTVGTS